MLQFNHPISLKEIALNINAELHIPKTLSSDLAEKYITSVATIETANSDQITFLANQLYVKYLSTTNAGAILIHPQHLDKCATIALVTNNPRLALAKLLKLCDKSSNKTGIHTSCVFGENLILGQNVTIEPGVVVGDNCSIGNNTTIKANTVLYSNVRIGDNCLIHSNTVIGSDGFGFAKDDNGNWIKMPHLGGVIIEDNVEIGSNTSVDRGCMGDTIIKKGVIIDNLVQIAHNVVIGEGTAIAGCVGIAGSTVIGKNCLIGGAVSIAGHLVITDDVHITATSSINKSLLKIGVYSSGLPAKSNSIWKKNIARFNLLDQSFRDILQRIKQLEQNFNTEKV